MSSNETQVFYFGDSLTDVGVIFDALVQALSFEIFQTLLVGLGPNPTPEQIALAQQQAVQLGTQQALIEGQARGLGPENAVTNEFTHATYTGDIGGYTTVNFANAGARALGTQEPFGDGTGYDSNLGAQLARFAALPPGAVAPGADAVLFIGSNDFSDALGGAISDPNGSVLDLLFAAGDAIGDLLTALESAARNLSASGLDTIYFGTLPLGSFFPGSDALDAISSGFSDLAVGLYNGLLTQTAATLRADGLDVQMIDYSALARAATEDPSSFGVIAERSEFLIDGAPLDSDQVGFWDPIHPGEAFHQAWGAYAAFVMDGGSTSLLSDFGTLNVQTNASNAVFAMGGDDTVFALSGDDVVYGGSGDDRVFAGRGDDIVSGGRGNDDIKGQSGNDILSGGRGDDHIRGGSGNDVLIDGLGNDLVRGGSGDDVFIFVEATLDGGEPATKDVFKGGSGQDTLYLVLDDAQFASFTANGAEAVLMDLSIDIQSIETVRAIDGREGVEAELDTFDWFIDADYWGVIPAPTQADLLI